jgi:hypothetical protein
MPKTLLALALAILLSASGRAYGQQLTPSGPVTASTPGQIVQNLDITANGQPCVRVTAASVQIRSVKCRHSGAHGIAATNANGLVISYVHVERTVLGPGAGQNNIDIFGSTGVRVDHVRLLNGAGGIYFEESSDNRTVFLDARNQQGPDGFGGGSGWQVNRSDGAVLEDFNVINQPNPAIAKPEDNVSCYNTNNCTVRRGLVEGNNSEFGQAFIIEFGRTHLIEDLDAVNVPASFGVYGNGAGDVQFTRTRLYNMICHDQGRGIPSSGGIIWNAETIGTDNLGVDGGVYWDPDASNGTLCGNLVYPPAAFNPFNVTKLNFSPRAPIEIVMPWEGPPACG